MDRPNWECTCPRFHFHKECRHVKELWDGMSGFQRAMCVKEGFKVGEKKIR